MTRRRKVKVKANAMESADVSFVSMVTRPASRIPFRVLKSEDDPEEGKMINMNLSKMFKRDGDSARSQGIALAGVILQKQHAEHFAPKLKALGIKLDAITEQDGCLILKQMDFEQDDVTAVKLGEMAGLFTNVPEEVRKAFDPWPESENFGENMASGGFLPGVSIATEIMMDTVRNVLRSADNAQGARDGIAATIDAYKSAVMQLAGNLPEVAFKIEAMDLEGFEAPKEDAGGDKSQKADDAGASADADAAAAAQNKAAKADDGKDAGAVASDSTGITDAERKALKGVHIEALEDGSSIKDDAAAKAKADDNIIGSVACPECSEETPVAKAEDHVHKMTCPKCGHKWTQKAEGAPDDKSSTQDNDPSGVAKALSEVLEVVKGVRSEVAGLSKKQDELAKKVDATAATADKAIKAVKGVVPSNSDAGDRIPNESLGTRRSKTEEIDEATWGGTALDKIVGDYPQASGQ